MKREFHVFTEPHVADPAWVIPCVEMIDTDGIKSGIHYQDATELMETAWGLQYKLGVQSGRTSEATRVRRYLEKIGWNEIEIRTLMFWKPE